MAIYKLNGAFQSFHDPRGNPLIALNRDGSVFFQSLLFSDGSTQNTAATGTVNFADAEVPTGLINGSNKSFTLLHSPSPIASLILVSDGIVLTAGGVGYTLTGAAITTVTAPASSLIAWYRY